MLTKNEVAEVLQYIHTDMGFSSEDIEEFLGKFSKAYDYVDRKKMKHSISEKAFALIDKELQDTNK